MNKSARLSAEETWRTDMFPFSTHSRMKWCRCWNVRSRGVDVHWSREYRLRCKTYETHLSLVLMSSPASFVAFQLALPVFICIYWTFAYLELCVYIYSICRISFILSCCPLFVSLSFDLSFRLLGPERCNLKS